MLKFVISRIWRTLLVFAGVYVLAAVLFYLFEKGHPAGPETFGDALWYCLVTMSTVGYGDMFPQTPEGRLVGVALIVFSLGALGFIIGRIGEVIVEGKQQEQFGLRGTEFEDHIVLVGWSEIGEVALTELLGAGERIAVVCETEDLLFKLRQRAPKRQLFLLRGEGRNPRSLDLVNIRVAKVVIICDEDDTRNLVAALNVRRANPNVELVVMISNDELRHTFREAGVSFVANPSEISGRLVASAAFEPEVAKFIEDITSAENVGGFDLEQHTIPATFSGKSVSDLRQEVERKSGALLVALIRRGKDGFYQPNPPQDLELAGDDVAIFLTNAEQSKQLEAVVGVAGAA